MKFDDEFNEPVCFSDGQIVVSREAYTREMAASIINDYEGKNCTPEQLTEERVRFGFFQDIYDIRPRNCWHFPANGKGSRAVWVLD